MIEFGRTPVGRRMTAFAAGALCTGAELPVVNVFMARTALFGGTGEGNLPHRAFRRGLVAGQTVHCAMPPEKGEIRSAVVEGYAFFPRRCGVATFASESGR